MSDITAAPTSATGGIKLPGLGEIGAFMKRGDIALAVGVLSILVVLILPLPPLLLDVALATSIIISVLILMTSLFIQAPLILLVPDHAADRHHVAAGAQPRLDA